MCALALLALVGAACVDDNGDEGSGDDAGGGSTTTTTSETVSFADQLPETAVGPEAPEEFRAFGERLEQVDEAVDGVIAEAHSEADPTLDNLAALAVAQCVEFDGAPAAAVLGEFPETVDFVTDRLTTEGADPQAARAAAQLVLIGIVLDPDLCGALADEGIPPEARAELATTLLSEQDPALADALRTAFAV